MTGPEHYREAERLLTDRPSVADWTDRPVLAQEHWQQTLAEAQVHATLALTAAMAMPTNTDEISGNGIANAWLRAVWS